MRSKAVAKTKMDVQTPTITLMLLLELDAIKKQNSQFNLQLDTHVHGVS